MYVHHTLVAGTLPIDSEVFREAALLALEGLEKRDPALVRLAKKLCGGGREAALWFATENATLGTRSPLALILGGQRALVVYALMELETGKQPAADDSANLVSEP